MDRALDGFAALAVVLVVYGASELVGAYGLLALFAAGFAFRRYEFEHELHRGIHHGADTASTFLELSVLLLLGTMLTLEGLGEPGLAGWLLAPMLIVAIRPARNLLYSALPPPAQPALALGPSGRLQRAPQIVVGVLRISPAVRGQRAPPTLPCRCCPSA